MRHRDAPPGSPPRPPAPAVVGPVDRRSGRPRGRAPGLGSGSALVLMLLCAVGCDAWGTRWLEPGAEIISSDPLHLDVELLGRVPLDAVLPSDLQPTPDGGFAVLDGYARRILRFAGDGQGSGPALVLGGAGRPVRMAMEGDGTIWVTVPGTAAEPGALQRIGAQGGLLEEVALPVPARSGPVAAARLEGGMVVSDRTGRVLRFEPGVGAGWVVQAAEDGSPLGPVVDLAPDGAGGLLLVEPGRGRVLGLSDAGVVSARLDRAGPWVGSLLQPKSAAAGPGGVLLVADSALASVQAFTEEGAALGPLSVLGELLRIDHPVAIRTVGESTWAVLAAGTPEVLLLRIELSELARARAEAGPRRLRRMLAPADRGELCVQCHDGFVRDSRAVWDPDRPGHPVGVPAPATAPDALKLDADGRIACRTCHSPHAPPAPPMGGSPLRGSGAALVQHRDREGVYLRLTTRGDALCAACHEGAEHGGLDALVPREPGGRAGQGHRAGRELRASLSARRGAGAAGASGCLGCHAAHGGRGQTLLR